MEWQTAYRPCPGTRRTKELGKRCGLTPGRSSNARFFRDLLFFENLRLYRPLAYRPRLLSVFFPLLLQWCLLYLCVFTFVNFGYYLPIGHRESQVRSRLNTSPGLDPESSFAVLATAGDIFSPPRWTPCGQ